MTGQREGFVELITWFELADRAFDDEETILVQHADGDVCGAFLDGDTWRNLDATECPTPVAWAKWPRGRT